MKINTIKDVPAQLFANFPRGQNMTDARTWIGDASAADGLGLELDKLKSHSTDAAAVTEILNSDKIARLFDMRREVAAAAKAAQASFRRWSIIAILGTTLATFASGLLLYDAGSAAPATQTLPQPATADAPSAPAPSVPPVAAAQVPRLVLLVHNNHTFLILIQIIGLFLAAVASSFLTAQNFSERWSDNRRKAELLRREIFLEVVKQAVAMVPSPLNPPDFGNPLSQAMELFRRWQHDLQIRFYAKGVDRHGRTAMTLTLVTAVLAGVAAISGVIGAFGEGALVVSAFLGIAVPILLSAAQSWRLAGGDTEKAAAYKTAKEQLDRIALEKLADVRKKAAAGDTAAVLAYVDDVHLVMTTENDAWSPVAKQKPAAP